MNDYPDTNGNGIPDAFERRLPISEILNTEPTSAELHGTVIIEIEKTARAPRKGEYFICGHRIEKADFNYSEHTSNLRLFVIKRVIAGSVEGLDKT